MAKHIHLHAHEVGPRECAFEPCSKLCGCGTPGTVVVGCTRRSEFGQCAAADLKPCDQLSVCVRGAPGFKIWLPADKAPTQLHTNNIQGPLSYASLTTVQKEQLERTAVQLARDKRKDGAAPLKVNCEKPGGECTLETSRWVGRIAASKVVVVIAPKPYVPIGPMALLELQLRALGARDFPSDTSASEHLQNVDYALLIAGVYAQTVQAALQRTRGALPDYRSVRQPCSVIRGRIDVRASLKQPMGLDCPPLICAFEELTVDTPQNRLLKAAARRATVLIRSHHQPQHGTFTDQAVARLRKSERLLSGVADVKPYTARELDMIDMKPQHARYKPYQQALRLAKLLLSHSSVNHYGRIDGVSFLVNLDNVFEEFVRRSVSTVFKACKETRPLATKGSGDSVVTVNLKPDVVGSVVVEGKKRQVVVGDAKHKRLHLDKEGKLVTKRDDIFQILAYMNVYNAACGFLVYAACDPPSQEADRRFLRLVMLPGDRPLLLVCVDLRERSSRAAEQIKHAARHCVAFCRGNVQHRQTGLGPEMGLCDICCSY